MKKIHLLPLVIYLLLLNSLALAQTSTEDEVETQKSGILTNVRVFEIWPRSFLVTNGKEILEFRRDRSSYCYSINLPNGINLKKKDLVEIHYRKIGPGVYLAKEIQVLDRPTKKEAYQVWWEIRARMGKDIIHMPSADLPGKIVTKVIIDTRQQKAFVYGPKNRLLAVSYCVTGRNKWPTTHGSFRIYRKESNRFLDGREFGEFYHLWVNYWMPFNRHMGLHDAGWRKSFRIDPRFYGSHGCVNLPGYMAKFIFRYSRVGTPVVVI